MSETEQSERNRALINQLEMTELEVFYVNYEYEFQEPSDNIVTFRTVFTLMVLSPDIEGITVLQRLLEFIRQDIAGECMSSLKGEQDMFVTEYSREIE